MPASQQSFPSTSPAMSFVGPSSIEPAAAPANGTPQMANAAPPPAPGPGPSFYQNGPNANGNGNGYNPQTGPYNQYQPPHHPAQSQPYNQHAPSHQHHPHQPYYGRNQSGFRGQQNQHHQNQHHQHQQHQQQHPHTSAYQNQPEPSQPPQNQYPHAPHQLQHQNSNSHLQQHNASYQNRYPDPSFQGGYGGWTGGGGPYYPSPNQPYPQMGGPGPATMQNQNGYAYGVQGYGGAMYAGGPGQGPGGYDGRPSGEGESSAAIAESDPQSATAPNFPPGPGPPSDFPYPPASAASTQSPHPHPASIPPGPNGAGPYQPPYFPPNHPYNYGGGIGVGYAPYAPVQGYGGYGFGDGFMPPPTPNGVAIPPINNGSGPLPPPQTNGPTRSLNPAAQGFKFVPSHQPPPPASAPPPPIAAPPPPAEAPTGPVGDAPVPVFASIQRAPTPKKAAPPASQQKVFQPVMVDGEKLKGIGGKRRESEGEYAEPPAAAIPTLAGGDVLGLSEAQPNGIDLHPVSPLDITQPAPETSAAPATETAPAPASSAQTPSSPPVDTSKTDESSTAPSTHPQTAAASPSKKDTADLQGKIQFYGPTMKGYMSPPSNGTPPSLAQAMAPLQSQVGGTAAASSSKAGPSKPARKPKAVMDGPVVFTSTRPEAKEKGENAYKSTATLLSAGSGSAGSKKGNERAQRRRAVLAFGEGLKAGKGRKEAEGAGRRMRFGSISEEAETAVVPAKLEAVKPKPEATAPVPSSQPPEASAPPSREATSTPAPAPAPDAESAAPSPAAAPAVPRPKAPPTSWAALVGSRATTSASSVASTTATPTPSAGPSKLPSPSRSTAPLPTTPELSSNETLPSAPKSVPTSAASAPAAKRPAFNYAAAAAAGAALSPADELVKLLSEGLGNRGAAPGVSKGTIPRGLINTGNMCFINTTLAYCPPFTDLLETLGQRLKADLGRKTPLLESVIVFLRELQPSGSALPLNVVNGALPTRGMTKANTAPTSFQQTGRGVGGKDAFVPENVYDAMKENKRFDSMRRGFQEDAEEYLGFFLNTLHEELLYLLSRTHTRSTPQANGTPSSEGREHSIERPLSPSAQADSGGASAWLEVGKKQRTHVVRSNEARESAITRIFGGTLRSILHIPGAKDSVTLEPYQPLQLDISDPASTMSVVDALRHLSTPETVQTWSAAKKENVDATKTVFVETWPAVLICHLKRFVYDAEEREVVKKSRAVAYGTELIVPNEIISPTKRSSVPVKYRLFGVVYHHGSTAGGGHYTVAVSRQDHQQWIHFDDETVQPVATDQVVVSPEEAESGRAGLIGGREKCAYLLFYQRVRA